MKHRARHIMRLLCIAILFEACSGDDSSESRESFDVNLGVNQCHDYSLGSFGDDEGALVTREPRRYDSSILRRESGGTMRYKYCPTRQFVGTDEVEITATRLTNPKTTITTIRYVISK